MKPCAAARLGPELGGGGGIELVILFKTMPFKQFFPGKVRQAGSERLNYRPPNML
jgi:hypothetical protein